MSVAKTFYFKAVVDERVVVLSLGVKALCRVKAAAKVKPGPYCQRRVRRLAAKYELEAASA